MASCILAHGCWIEGRVLFWEGGEEWGGSNGTFLSFFRYKASKEQILSWNQSLPRGRWAAECGANEGEKASSSPLLEVPLQIGMKAWGIGIMKLWKAVLEYFGIIYTVVIIWNRYGMILGIVSKAFDVTFSDLFFFLAGSWFKTGTHYPQICDIWWRTGKLPLGHALT